jgi:hypothetical protein
MNDQTLESIEPAHLLGCWEVTERMLKGRSNQYFLSTANLIEFHESGTFVTIGGNEIFGTWKVNRAAQLIYNPQLQFRKNDLELERAIITRLYEEIENNEPVRKLRLFFDRELEVVLKKINID